MSYRTVWVNSNHPGIQAVADAIALAVEGERGSLSLFDGCTIKVETLQGHTFPSILIKGPTNCIDAIIKKE